MRISTGITLLDLVVGGDKDVLGYPPGKIINIVGDSSVGKSFLCCELIAATYDHYGNKLKWVYDDCESGFTFDTKSLYGIEIVPEDPGLRFRSTTVESLYGNVRTFLDSLKDDEFGIYVVDSLDGLTSIETESLGDELYKKHKEEKELEVGSYRMAKAKFLSQQFFPDMADRLQHKNVLLIIVSQVRDNIAPGSFVKKIRAGGKALDFYAYCVVWLRLTEKVEEKGIPVSVAIRADVKKLKAPRPFRSCVFPIIFDYGADNIGANIDYFYDNRTEGGKIRSKRAKFEWGGSEYSRAKLIQYIEDNGLQEELNQMVIDKWENTEDSIKSSRVTKYERK